MAACELGTLSAEKFPCASSDLPPGLQSGCPLALTDACRQADSPQQGTTVQILGDLLTLTEHMAAF